jgi:hypothetical protein
MDRGETVTGTDDITFNLISVCYHALNAADNCAAYMADAEASGDQSLVDLLKQVIDDNRKVGERAKELLSDRIGRAVEATTVPPSMH